MSFYTREKVTGGRLEKLNSPIRRLGEDQEIDLATNEYFIEFADAPIILEDFFMITRLSDDNFTTIAEAIIERFGNVVLHRKNNTYTIKRGTYKAPYSIIFELVFKVYKSYTKVCLVPHMLNRIPTLRYSVYTAMKQ